MCCWNEVEDLWRTTKAVETDNTGKKRQRGDLIEVYKILTGKEDIDSSCLFQLASQHLNLRGHHLKLYKKPCHLNVRKYYFSQDCQLLEVCRGSSIREQLQEPFGQIFYIYGLPIKLCFLCPSSTSTSKELFELALCYFLCPYRRLHKKLWAKVSWITFIQATQQMFEKSRNRQHFWLTMLPYRSIWHHIIFRYVQMSINQSINMRLFQTWQSHVCYNIWKW